MSRNLTNLAPSESFQYLIQVDSDNKVQTGLGNPFTPATASYADTASFAKQALTASYAANANVDTSSLVTNATFNTFTSSYKQDSASFSASFASLSASVQNITGSGTPTDVSAYLSSSWTASYYADSASFSASIANLYTGSGGGVSTDTLQDVTSRGNQTSESINITGSLSNGSNANAIGIESHAEGSNTTALGLASHAEGYFSTAVGIFSHAEGGGYEFASLFEGRNIAIGMGSHAEGSDSTAVGITSHAEGGYFDFYEKVAGGYTIGRGSHAEGEATTTLAAADLSHAEGLHTITSDKYQHAQGQYNLEVAGQSAFILGNGVDNANRSNLIYAQGNKVQITGSLDVTGSITLNGAAITAGGGGGSTDVSAYLSSSWTGSSTSLFEGTSSFAATASYVSGAILNTPDPYTSTAPIFRMISLTSAQYTAIVTKDPNTVYVII